MRQGLLRGRRRSFWSAMRHHSTSPTSIKPKISRKIR
jgi:hypothetical protein